METPNSFDQILDNCGIQIPTSEVNVGEPSLSVMRNNIPLPPRHQLVPAEKSRVTQNLDMAAVDAACKTQPADLDPKTLRRTISNRQSAQRSRMKRSQYITDMLKRVQDLEEYIASMRPKIESCKEQNRLLELENDSLKKQVDLRTAESMTSQDSLEEKKRELKELKEQLNYRMMSSSSSSNEMGVPGSFESNPKPYSLEFYQEKMMHMEMNEFINQELTRWPSEPGPFSKMTFEDENEEVDQYLNLEDDITLHLDDL